MYSIEDELRRRAAHDAFSRGMGLKAAKQLRTTFQQVAKELSQQSLSLSRRAELTAFLARASGSLGEAYNTIAREAVMSLQTLARAEGQHVLAHVNAVLDTQYNVALSAERLAAVTELPIMELSLGEWWKREARDMTARVKSAIQSGLLQGRSMREIARAVAGMDARDRSAYRAALARAMTVTRTTASAVATATDRTVFESLGAGITDRYIYRATLDGRTSTVCRAADGRTFQHGASDALYPPLHPNCRSTVIPLLNPKGLDRARLARFYGTDGRLPPTRSLADYEAFLKKQPPKVLEQILGTSAKAYKAGRLTLTDALASNRTAFTTYDELVAALPPAPKTPPPSATAAGQDLEIKFDQSSFKKVSKMFTSDGMDKALKQDSLEAFVRAHFAGLDPKQVRLALRFDSTDGQDLYVIAEVFDKKTGAHMAKIQRVFEFSFDQATGRLSPKTVGHELFDVEKDYQALGFAKSYLDNAVRQYRSIGFKSVETYANIDVGGYAWARYGFVPSSPEVYKELISNIFKGPVRQMLYELDRRSYEAMVRLVRQARDMDPAEGIRLIADSQWGKRLLMKRSWSGRLDLTDTLTNTRWDAYVAQKKFTKG